MDEDEERLVFFYNFNPTYRNFEGSSDSNSQIKF